MPLREELRGFVNYVWWATATRDWRRWTYGGRAHSAIERVGRFNMTSIGKKPLFTILVPVHRPPNLLPFALRSIQAQTVKNFEVFVICDGAPPETVACAEEFAGEDARIRVFSYEKGARLGEAYRDVVLQSARSKYVAQLADDDLWFPDYLSEMSALLETVHFGNLIQSNLGEDGKIDVYPGVLDDIRTRSRMLAKKWNFFGPSFAGYHLSTYRELPVGWSPAPETLPTDLYMWRKFLACGDLIFGTRFSVQGAKLGANRRLNLSLDARGAEHARTATLFAKQQGRRDFQARAMVALYRAQTVSLSREIRAAKSHGLDRRQD